MAIDLSAFELHNLEFDQGRLAVRDALRSQISASTIRSGSELVAGFSVESSSTTETFHYLFLRNTTTADGYVHVTTEEFRDIAVLHLGSLPERPIITYAFQNQQILINGPGLAPLYAIVGGGITRAVKVESVNPSTTAIEIPSGICCAFGDRIAIAQGNTIYFNDAGTEIRTYVGENGVSLSGTIYDIFQGPGGALISVTSDGIYALPSDALGQGQIVFGFFSKISGYQASNYRNATASRNRVFTLLQHGLGLVTDEIVGIPLTSYRHKRFYTEYVGPGAAGDYRSGSIWKSERGVLVNTQGKVCQFDYDSQKTSWIYANSDIELVGIGRSRDGVDLWITPERVLEQIGNAEFDGYEVKGFACGIVPTDPSDSLVVRAVTTISDNVGQDQYAYLGGRDKSAETPPPSRAANVIGTDVWSASAAYVGQEERSRRHLFAERLDEIAIEVGAEGSGARLGVIDVLTKGKSSKRP